MEKNKTFIISGTLILAMIGIEFFSVAPHAYYWWHELRGFDAIFGFAACLFLVKLAKGLGKLFIQKNEDYYDGGEENDAC